VTLSLPDFNLSDEQREFRDMLRRFFEEHAPIAEVRRVMESEACGSLELWQRACQELGLAGLALPEAHSGQGFGLPELGLALGETGRCLAPLPLFASAGLAGRAVEAVAATADAGEWLAPIAAGGVATLAWLETSTDWGVEAVACEAVSDGAAARLSGEKRYVIDAREAERFFVVARAPGSRGPDGLGLYALEREAAGLSLAPQESLDLTRKLTTLRLDGAQARSVGTPGADGPALARVLEDATALLCAEMVGGMERVLESAVDYAKGRFQFGRAIGSFQAIKHRCADMLIAFEGARTAVAAALSAAAEDAAQRAVLTAVAKAHCGRAYDRIAVGNMQIQGGVGYTWEYDAHLYYRRARSSDVLFGDASLHHEKLAWLLAEGAA
jgi:alkylation response protein AidB-like acyl-CoA dehydrogenase